ncbi:MAG: NAD(P)H-dependent oxidoreductase [Ahrensia sp.]|nr:NAD(P)H-dependent oxidoreductase [Ahrensia sp.]
MKALLVFCHPKSDSFTAAVAQTVIEELENGGAQVKVIDLYRAGYDPVITASEWDCYEDCEQNCMGQEETIEALKWCNSLIFVYPTWWYGMPAMLKGWLEKVLVPGVAFHMPSPDGGNIKPGLRHITKLAVFTTCGASRWLTTFIGAPGKRTLLRGVRLLCARKCKTTYAAHYLMDSSTPESRKAHLETVRDKAKRMVGTQPAPAARLEPAE